MPDGWDCADADRETINALIVAAMQSSLVAEGMAAFDAPVMQPNACELPPFAVIPKRRFVYDRIYQHGTVSHGG